MNHGNNKKKALFTALFLTLGVTGVEVQAAQLYSYNLLTINSGVANYDSYGYSTDVSSGSWFALEGDNNSKIAGSEKVAINPGSDGGLIIGVTQAPGEIDGGWSFFGYSGGGHYTTVAPTGGTTNGVDMSGWAVYWNGLNIPMGTGAWTPQNCATLGCSGMTFSDGVATLVWDGLADSAYSLWYTATVPPGDPSGFGGVQYMLHLEGIVTSVTIVDPPPVPVPAAAWLFGTGLLGLLGVARRRRIG